MSSRKTREPIGLYGGMHRVWNKQFGFIYVPVLLGAAAMIIYGHQAMYVAYTEKFVEDTAQSGWLDNLWGSDLYLRSWLVPISATVNSVFPVVSLNAVFKTVQEDWAAYKHKNAMEANDASSFLCFDVDGSTKATINYMAMQSTSVLFSAMTVFLNVTAMLRNNPAWYTLAGYGIARFLICFTCLSDMLKVWKQIADKKTRLEKWVHGSVYVAFLMYATLCNAGFLTNGALFFADNVQGSIDDAVERPDLIMGAFPFAVPMIAMSANSFYALFCALSHCLCQCGEAKEQELSSRARLREAPADDGADAGLLAHEAMSAASEGAMAKADSGVQVGSGYEELGGAHSGDEDEGGVEAVRRSVLPASRMQDPSAQFATWHLSTKCLAVLSFLGVSLFASLSGAAGFELSMQAFNSVVWGVFGFSSACFPNGHFTMRLLTEWCFKPLDRQFNPAYSIYAKSVSNALGQRSRGETLDGGTYPPPARRGGRGRRGQHGQQSHGPHGVEFASRPLPHTGGGYGL